MLKYFGKYLVIIFVGFAIYYYLFPFVENREFFIKQSGNIKPLILNDPALCRYLYKYSELAYNHNYANTIKHINQLIQASIDSKVDPLIKDITRDQYRKALNSWHSLIYNQAIWLTTPGDLQPYLQKYLNYDCIKGISPHLQNDNNHTYFLP